MDTSGDLPIGLHETLLTDGLEEQLGSIVHQIHEYDAVDDADLPHVLAQHLSALALKRLSAIKDPGARITLANAVLQAIDELPDPVTTPARQLHALRLPDGPGTDGRLRKRPKTPLNDAALLTNAPGEPSLASELRAEIDSADSIDLLCAFVMWHGLRLIEGELAAARQAGIPIRVVTTTYIGGTERRALDRLVQDFGAEVKVQYDAKRTRLHAKAWLFDRHTGYDTAYVGSSNLTTSAMLEGVEWNVRLSAAATPPSSTSSGRPSMPTGTVPSSSPTTRSGTATGSTTPFSRPRESRARIASRSRSWVSTSVRTPINSRCWMSSRQSASSMTVIAISWWQPRAPARR